MQQEDTIALVKVSFNSFFFFFFFAFRAVVKYFESAPPELGQSTDCK